MYICLCQLLAYDHTRWVCCVRTYKTTANGSHQRDIGSTSPNDSKLFANECDHPHVARWLSLRDSSCFMYPLDNPSRHLSARYSHNYIFNNISSVEGGWKVGWEPKGASYTAFSVTVVFSKGAMASLSREGWRRWQCQMRAQSRSARIWAFAGKPIQRASGIVPAERSRSKSVAFVPPPGTGPCCSQPGACTALLPGDARRPWHSEQVKEQLCRSPTCMKVCS